MATTLQPLSRKPQALIKDNAEENAEKPHNKEREDEGKLDPSNKKEEEVEKSTPHIDSLVDQIE